MCWPWCSARPKSRLRCRTLADAAATESVFGDHDARSFDVVSIDYNGTITPVTTDPGQWTASRGERGIVVSGRDMRSARAQMRHILGEQSATIASTAAEPGFTPNVTFTRLGEHQLYTAIIAPSPESPYAHAEKLPVLMKPYGGPGFQQVIASQSFYWEGQWWADQGFLVVTADGRGTTGRGPAWDREIFEDMKDVTLADQSRPSTPCPRPSPGSTPMWNHVRHSRLRAIRQTPRHHRRFAPPPASGRRFPCRTSTRCA